MRKYKLVLMELMPFDYRHQLLYASKTWIHLVVSLNMGHFICSKGIGNIDEQAYHEMNSTFKKIAD